MFSLIHFMKAFSAALMAGVVEASGMFAVAPSSGLGVGDSPSSTAGGVGMIGVVPVLSMLVASAIIVVVSPRFGGDCCPLHAQKDHR